MVSSKDLTTLLTETHAGYEAYGEYYDRMYAAMKEKPGTYKPAVATAYADLIQSLGCKDVLDCACGTGDPAIGVALRGGINVTASDMSDMMLKKCVLNTQEEGLLNSEPIGQNGPIGNLDIVKACWQELPAKFGSNRFDMVICPGHGFFHLISHGNMLEALRSMSEVVKPGGYVIFDIKRWEDTADLHQEVGFTENVTWRGWLDCGEMRLMFVHSTRYYDDSRGVEGVIQQKNFYVFEETPLGLNVKVEARFWGAPFRKSTADNLLRETGLVDVHEVVFENMPAYNSKYLTIIGKKIS